MKVTRYVKLLMLLIVTLTSVYATSLEIQMPKEVKVGDEFNITLNVKNNQSIAGFECNVYVPRNLKIIGFSGNETIKKMAKKFYEEKITNNSCLVKFAIFKNPIKTDFYVGRITVKVVGYDNNTKIRIISKGSDENGNRIDIYSGDIQLKIKKEIKKEETKNESFLDMIINFLKKLFK